MTIAKNAEFFYKYFLSSTMYLGSKKLIANSAVTFLCSSDIYLESKKADCKFFGNFFLSLCYIHGVKNKLTAKNSGNIFKKVHRKRATFPKRLLSITSRTTRKCIQFLSVECPAPLKTVLLLFLAVTALFKPLCTQKSHKIKVCSLSTNLSADRSPKLIQQNKR